MTDNLTTAPTGVPEPDNSPETDTEDTERNRPGVPVWVSLVGLLGALVLAAVVGIRVCPVLSALVFPPAPPLPPGDVNLLQPQENLGLGLDEWLYGTDMNACLVMKYYQDRLGGCTYDPSVNCDGPGIMAPELAISIPVGVCQSRQTIGAYSVTWTVRIGTNYTEGGLTQFRITREVTN